MTQIIIQLFEGAPEAGRLLGEQELDLVHAQLGQDTIALGSAKSMRVQADGRATHYRLLLKGFGGMLALSQGDVVQEGSGSMSHNAIVLSHVHLRKEEGVFFRHFHLHAPPFLQSAGPDAAPPEAVPVAQPPEPKPKSASLQAVKVILPPQEMFKILRGRENRSEDWQLIVSDTLENQALARLSFEVWVGDCQTGEVITLRSDGQWSGSLQAVLGEVEGGQS